MEWFFVYNKYLFTGADEVYDLDSLLSGGGFETPGSALLQFSNIPEAILSKQLARQIKKQCFVSPVLSLGQQIMVVY